MFLRVSNWYQTSLYFYEFYCLPFQWFLINSFILLQTVALLIVRLVTVKFRINWSIINLHFYVNMSYGQYVLSQAPAALRVS